MEIRHKIVDALYNDYIDKEFELKDACVIYIRETVLRYGKREKLNSVNNDSGLCITLDLKKFLKSEQMPHTSEGEPFDEIQMSYGMDDYENIIFKNTDTNKTYDFGEERKNARNLVHICDFLYYDGNFKIQED